MRTRFRPWRIVNVILLVSAFTAPWLSSCTEDFGNNDFVRGHQVVRIALVFATSNLIEDLLFRGMCAVFLVGVVFTALYSFANIIEISGAKRNWRRPLRPRMPRQA